jgi:3-dehydroquinate synthase
MTSATVPVPVAGAGYDVVLGAGLLAHLDELVRGRCPASRYAVITDSTVAQHYGKRVAQMLDDGTSPSVLAIFPAGEWNKTRETWASLTDQLLTARLDREAAIVAVGGGVVGDLAGFVAATYQRGIPHVQVPTSLLAMIDSSIGGKTGVDTSHGKNLVGAFHQPRLVLTDVETLATLPPVQLASGMAEAIKHGVIADAVYLDALLEGADAVRAGETEVRAAVVRRSVEIKAAIVAEDEREAGRRAVLNFGHTVAHALETALGYELLHGEAVAIGMAVESALGERLGVTHRSVADAVRDALEALRLPTELPGGAAPDQVLEILRRDKKVRAGTVRFALPRRLGEMARADDGSWTIAVPEADVLDTLRASHPRA